MTHYVIKHPQTLLQNDYILPKDISDMVEGSIQYTSMITQIYVA